MEGGELQLGRHATLTPEERIRKQREYAKAYYYTHREKCNEYAKAYYDTHREERNATRRAWYHKNIEQRRAYNRERQRIWREEHPEEYEAAKARITENNRKRRQRKTIDEAIEMLSANGYKVEKIAD